MKEIKRQKKKEEIKPPVTCKNLHLVRLKEKNEKRNIKSKYARKKWKDRQNSNNNIYIIYIGIKIEFRKKKKKISQLYKIDFYEI